MELTFAQQSTAFLFSLLLGVGFGIFYAPFKMFRLAFCSKKSSIIAVDIIFMLLVSVVIYYFSIVFIMGYVRIYIFVGCIAGFLVYRLTLGSLLSRVYVPIITFLKKITNKIMQKLKKFTKKLLKITRNILYNIIKRSSKIKAKTHD
ncbi:MAG: spore cortex biosynthesis protein YabQ [Ruminococcus sp.]|nr:spore cortex biosynthesis protein YabQ [Ruminococcus sp.]